MGQIDYSLDYAVLSGELSKKAPFVNINSNCTITREWGVTRTRVMTGDGLDNPRPLTAATWVARGSAALIIGQGGTLSFAAPRDRTWSSHAATIYHHDRDLSWHFVLSRDAQNRIPNWIVCRDCRPSAGILNGLQTVCRLRLQCAVAAPVKTILDHSAQMTKSPAK